ncbi:MAG: AAA family ATPase [Desulfobacteraceae bacterium]|nr:AAA family ATPase [Desulfobacteraceae bacterium]MBC2756289.1 AAA family ATPase [Desulfobacteraceae bacterium]
MIERVYIENYKTLKELDLSFNEDLNIIVGDNESGKSTLLEAISMALTGQLNGRYISYELSPYLFNVKTVKRYIKRIKKGKKVNPPHILIELYLTEKPETAKLKGTNNTKRENTAGVSLRIEFDEDYKEEYEKYISDPDAISVIPSEYYTVKWYSFAFANITKRSLPINTTLVDTTTIRLQNRTDYYIQEIINDSLSPKEKTQLSLTYRQLKETFAEDEALHRINTELKSEKGKISDKDLTVSIDISQRSGWETSLTSYLDDIPFHYIGKGDQNILKTLLALDRKAEDTHIILIEEPENHLSYSTMNKLIWMIGEKCDGKQLFITTHSTFVSNKLGLDKVIMLSRDLKTLSLRHLSPETQKYFKKLPGYDTLRLLIAQKAILVEGPSDELFVQKAYNQVHGKLPIEDGIDVISVRGLSFKRFLEIAKIINLDVAVVTDNDENFEKHVEEKYADYLAAPNINICYDTDDDASTLELQIVKYNKLDKMNQILGCDKRTKNSLSKYMVNNKTECALKIFESPEKIVIPDYIQEAIDG